MWLVNGKACIYSVWNVLNALNECLIEYGWQRPNQPPLYYFLSESEALHSKHSGWLDLASAYWDQELAYICREMWWLIGINTSLTEGGLSDIFMLKRTNLCRQQQQQKSI